MNEHHKTDLDDRSGPGLPVLHDEEQHKGRYRTRYSLGPKKWRIKMFMRGRFFQEKSDNDPRPRGWLFMQAHEAADGQDLVDPDRRFSKRHWRDMSPEEAEDDLKHFAKQYVVNNDFLPEGDKEVLHQYSLFAYGFWTGAFHEGSKNWWFSAASCAIGILIGMFSK